MVAEETSFCPVLRPTRAQFDRPFCDYVREQFNKHPDWGMFKVIPPKGWKPYKRSPKLEDVRIQTPIKQHVFGKSGAYMCILEEQRGMSAADFKKAAESSGRQAPQKGSRGSDDLQERAFWSSLTSNPPLYGADTPLSLFDKKLEFGWNFHNLHDLLKEKDVPDIPGVTTPMTYFGMWKSFFGWHKEDVDLYSINYLHMGAPKVWYCVSPKDGAKFEGMTQSLFPENYASCPAFMRHKDIMISPKVLRSYNVPFQQAKQEAGEFIVLNAAAYHAGFNMGFNCAEAVNFALPEWLELGRDCVNCECAALRDGVRLDMGIFFPELRRDSDSEEEEEEDSEDEASELGSSEEEGDEEGGSSSGEEDEEEDASDEEWQSSSSRSGRRRAAQRKRPEPVQQRSRRTARAAAAATPAARKRGRETAAQRSRSAKQRRTSSVAAVRTPKVPEVAKTARPEDTPRGAKHSQWGPVAEERPLAIVERDESSRELSFSLVHRLKREASKPGCVWVGLLAQGPDGLFRPTGNVRCAQLGMQYPRLAHVRSEWVQSGDRRKAGWKLLTKPERILM